MYAAKTHSSVAFEIDQRLRERCMGIMEGKPISELKKLAFLNKQNHRLFTPDEGESIENVEKRLDEFFRHLYESAWSKANEHRSGKLPRKQTVLVVTHSGVIRAFMSLFKKKYFCKVPSNLLDLKCGNTSRTLVEVTLTDGSCKEKSAANQHDSLQVPNPLPRVIKTRCLLLFCLTHLHLFKAPLDEL